MLDNCLCIETSDDIFLIFSKVIQGKFVLSLNDCDAVREIFKDFDFLEVETLWTSGMAKKHPEKKF